jgi:hypothetical protein
MDVHKPKPVRSWRELLTEIGVIVLSVCIALTAEQAVEWLHWRNEVTQARINIAAELGRNMLVSVNRVRTAQCTEQRLDILAGIVDAASRTGTLPPVGEFGRPATSAWPDETWQSVLASQTATHFSDKELALLGGAYGQIQRQGIRTRDEMLAWSHLYTMVGPGRRLDPASESVLRVALSEARYMNRSTSLVSGQIVRQIETLNLPFDAATRREIEDALHGPMRQAYVCAPMETEAPATYGQGQSRSYVYTLRDWLKYPPYAARPGAR